MTTKKSHQLTLKDKLSRLTYLQACQLIGEDGPKLLQKGGGAAIDIDQQVRLTDERFELRMLDRAGTVVTIDLSDGAHRRLRWKCNTSTTSCPAVGAAFSLILEEKMALGLAEPPPEDELPLELLSEDELVRRALAERAQRAATEKMQLRSSDPSTPWTDYTVTSAVSGKTYRVALRGEEPGQSFCSCPDFRTNTWARASTSCTRWIKIRRRFPAAGPPPPLRLPADLGAPALRRGADAARWKLPDRA